MTTTTRTRKPAAVKAAAHPLAHRIEPEVVSENYVNRLINGVLDMDYMRYARAARKNVLLQGPTGPGKTMMVRAFSSLERIPLVVVRCQDGIDPNTLWGMWVPNPAKPGSFMWQDSEITMVIEFGGILFLDEANFMHPRAAAGFHSLTDDQRCVSIMEQGNRVVYAHADLQVVSAFNPGYESTRKLNEAFKDRFELKADFDYDATVESALVKMPSLLEIADNLRDRVKNGDFDTPVSTRMLMAFEEFTQDVNLDFAIANFTAAFEPYERGALAEYISLMRPKLEADVQQYLPTE